MASWCMAAVVHWFDDPGEALAVSGGFLRSRPIEHNLILSQLRQRIAHPLPGHYWIASDAGDVRGVSLQSPLDFPATVTPMEPDAVRAVVEAMARDGIALPGVVGEAATTVPFAGHWSEDHQGGRMSAAGRTDLQAG